MACTENIKRFYGEKGSPLTIYNGALRAWFVALQSISHKAAVASLSLSPLVTDPAASRPPGERECGGLSLSPTVGH